MPKMLQPITATILVVAGAAHVPAQQSNALVGPVEVASVRRHDPADFTNIGISVRPGGTVVASNFPLRQLVAVAFRMQRSQVVGGPDWFQTEERYDIVARSSDGVGGGDAMRTILRAVLAERFKLVTHTETRELPVYALVPVRADARPGPRLIPAALACGTGPVAGSDPQPGASPRSPCVLSMPPGRIIGSGIDMRLLASSLSTLLDRPVTDRTGLSGGFDIDVEFTPDRGRGGGPGEGVPLVTALQEQLGLKVEPTRAPVEVLVIETLERPTEN